MLSINSLVEMLGGLSARTNAGFKAGWVARAAANERLAMVAAIDKFIVTTPTWEKTHVT